MSGVAVSGGGALVDGNNKTCVPLVADSDGGMGACQLEGQRQPSPSAWGCQASEPPLEHGCLAPTCPSCPQGGCWHAYAQRNAPPQWSPVHPPAHHTPAPAPPAAWAAVDLGYRGIVGSVLLSLVPPTPPNGSDGAAPQFQVYVKPSGMDADLGNAQACTEAGQPMPAGGGWAAVPCNITGR